MRGRNIAPVQRLLAIVEERANQILVGDLILLEVLQGATSEANAVRIERNLRAYSIAPMCGEAIALRAAQNYRTLRTQGITVRKTIAMVIGTFCIEGGHSLLHDDRDFDPMVRLLGLRSAL